MNVYIPIKTAADFHEFQSDSESTATATAKANFYPFPPSIMMPDVGPQWHCHLIAAVKTDYSWLPVWRQSGSGTFCLPLVEESMVIPRFPKGACCLPCQRHACVCEYETVSAFVCGFVCV